MEDSGNFFGRCYGEVLPACQVGHTGTIEELRCFTLHSPHMGKNAGPASAPLRNAVMPFLTELAFLRVVHCGEITELRHYEPFSGPAFLRVVHCGGIPESRNAGIPESRNAGIPKCRNPEMPELPALRTFFRTGILARSGLGSACGTRPRAYVRARRIMVGWYCYVITT